MRQCDSICIIHVIRALYSNYNDAKVTCWLSTIPWLNIAILPSSVIYLRFNWKEDENVRHYYCSQIYERNSSYQIFSICELLFVFDVWKFLIMKGRKRRGLSAKPFITHHIIFTFKFHSLAFCWSFFFWLPTLCIL